MDSNKYNRLPRAGDLEKTSGSEIIYLAPLPLPTGTAPLSTRQLQKIANDVYLDFGTESASLEFAVRCSIGSVTNILILTAVIGLGTGIAEYILYGASILEIALPFLFPNWFIWSFTGALALLYGYLLLKSIYQLTTYPPIRFNRQRREVAYVAKRGEVPRIVSWEKIIACVSNEPMQTEYGVQNHFALKIGLYDEADGQTVWLTIPSANPQSAVSEWEAIRVYMEEGPAALPVPFTAGMSDEGTVAYFHACRRNYRERHGYIRYVFGFLLIQFCSGWTLPNRLSEWVERLPKTSFPKAIREWSKPLPPEQWAKPSAELLEESAAVRRAFKKGIDLFAYFRENRIKSENPVDA